MTRRASLRSQRGTKRSAEVAALSEDEVSPEASDAAIAYALQMEEYEQPLPKKQKTAASKRSWQQARTTREILGTSSDSELSEWDLIDQSLNSEHDSDPVSDSEYNGEERQEREEGDQDVEDAIEYDDGMAEEDEDVLPLSWEEQRKARRVSSKLSQILRRDISRVIYWRPANRLTNAILDVRRSEEAREKASGSCHYVGQTEGDTCYHPKGRSAAGIHHSQAQTLPVGRPELDDAAGKD